MKKSNANIIKHRIPKIILLHFGVFLLSAPFITLIVLCLTSLLFGFVFPKAGTIIPIVFVAVTAIIFIVVFDLLIVPKVIQNVLSETVKEKRKESISIIFSIFLGLIYVTALVSIITTSLTSAVLDKKIKELKKAGFPTAFSDLCGNNPAGKNAAGELEKFSEKYSANDKKTQRTGDFIKENNIYFLIKKWGNGDKQNASKLVSNNSMLKNYKNIISTSDFYSFFDCNRKASDQVTNIQIPRFSAIMEYSNQTSYEARLYLNQGNFKGVYEDLEILKKSILFLHSEPFLLDSMFALALQKKIGQSLIALINDNVSDAQVKKLLYTTEVAKINLVERAMKGEVAFFVENYNFINKNKIIEIIQISALPLLYELLSGTVDMNFYIFLDGIEHYFINSSKEETAKNKKFSIWPFTDSSNLPRWQACFNSEKESDYILQNLNILQAAKNYYGINKKFPDRIEDLLKFGVKENQLIDPFLDGKEKIRMKSKQDGLYIYSVGKDGVDNDGDITDDDAGYLLWK